jgi:CheY-like chemotaxis protein
VDDDAPATLFVDDQRLQQVIKNLLSNALKFTDEGAVTLRVSADERGVAISVSDTGIGIAEEKLKLIFEAFQQADGTTSRRFGGTGLGLSISREIARMLGGELLVDSTPGAGATFTLRLPARYEPPAAVEGGATALGAGFMDAGGVPRAPVAAPQANGHGSPATILAPPSATGVSAALADRMDPVLLEQQEVEDDRDTLEQGDRVLLIIEDDPDFAAIVVDVAREQGLKAVVALRGDSGLSLAHRLAPDAIVLDVELPGADGLEVLDHLKQHTTTRHIPVHVVSGHDHRQQAMRAAAVAYLEKPVTREELADALGPDRRVRGSRRALRAPRRRRRPGARVDRGADRCGRRRGGRGGRIGRRRSRGARAPGLRLPGARLTLDGPGEDAGPTRRAPRPPGAGASSCSSACRPTGAGASCRSSSTRAGRCRATTRRGCGATRRRSSSRTSTRPSGSSTRRHCSCTGASRGCPPTSGGCSSSCTTPTPRCRASVC